MKKVLLLLTVLCGLSISSFAQSSSEGGKFSIGVEAGLPVGDVKNFTNFVIGGSLKYDHPIAEGTFVTISAGYNKFLAKDEAKDAGYKFYGIPVKAGIKHFFADGFYGEAQLGAAFTKESVNVDGFGNISGSKTAFAYSPGIGYTFGGGLDLGVRYEGWSMSGNTVSQIAARLAFSF
ncbi:outer membrane beta-barrel protein [Mucilaginibacter aquariorum]|uniref:Porin family protein n=1 Tax=Mucilaginibacter aquariorum TaxID=2967225 RepID=A0ABT1T0H1_9SPHI|nr:outer membrane beta-barrel protein [Mucilaginibacter aquariorum]MCQ6958090.1 porin family protein [Mucilaginibacter aquariorum]